MKSPSAALVTSGDGSRGSPRSRAALLGFDEDLRVLCWNDAAEALTGIRADEAVGRPCWDVIAGHDDQGGVVCHSGCSRARLVREGRCVPAAELHAQSLDGRRRISLETIAAQSEGGPLYLHVRRDAPARLRSKRRRRRNRLPG